jgi:hypothetical protein
MASLFKLEWVLLRVQKYVQPTMCRHHYTHCQEPRATTAGYGGGLCLYLYGLPRNRTPNRHTFFAKNDFNLIG